MLASTIITNVRRELVETVGSFWSDSELLTLINKGEADFVRRTRILEDRASTGTTAGDNRIPLPANWLSARAVFYDNLHSDGVHDWKPLRATNLEKMKQERPNFLATDTNLRSVPSKYWIWGRELNLDAVPDTTSSGNVVLFYKAKPTALTASTQNLNIDDSLADGIEAYVRWKAWKKEKEPDLAEEAREEYLDFVREGRSYVKRQSGDQHYRIDLESAVPIVGFPSIYNPFLE